MQRILVTGVTGAGKSTLAQALADAGGYPRLELDAIYHQPGWEPLPRAAFREEVSRFIARPRWVVDGNYSKVSDLIRARADTLVFLDLPRWRVLSQLIPRTLDRVFSKRELWNGNVESPWGLLSPSPDKNIVLWSVLTHGKRKRQFRAAQADASLAHLRFVRLGSRVEAQDFLKVLLAPL